MLVGSHNAGHLPKEKIPHDMQLWADVGKSGCILGGCPRSGWLGSSKATGASGGCSKRDAVKYVQVDVVLVLDGP